MTGLVVTQTLSAADDRIIQRIQMTAPRANALEPDLLQALHRAFDAIERQRPDGVLLCGGRHFSSGGDVQKFADATAEGTARVYANSVVPPLQDLILRMVALPCPVAAVVTGAATGGGAGLLFACDLAVAAPDAFVQPYYGQVGFAPDGGWTALLPERIGIAQAADWLHCDRRLDSAALKALGLVSDISKTPEDRALELLTSNAPGTASTIKALVWDAPRRALLRQRLDAEARAFVERIGSDSVAHGMERFLRQLRSPEHV